MIKSIYVGMTQEGLYIQGKYVEESGYTTYKFIEKELNKERAMDILKKLTSICNLPVFKFNDKAEKTQPVIVIPHFELYKNIHTQLMIYDEDVNDWLLWSIYGLNKTNGASELLVYGFSSKGEAVRYINDKLT